MASITITKANPHNMLKIKQLNSSLLLRHVSQSRPRHIPSTSITAAGNAQIGASSKRFMSTAFERGQDEEGAKGDRLTNILIRAIDAKPRTPPKPSKEEAEKRQKIARAYTIGSFKQHNEMQHDLACKLRMKNHAIDMLPKYDDEKLGYLKEAAMTVSIEKEFMPPYHRPIAVDTPPIPDFDPSKFMSEKD